MPVRAQKAGIPKESALVFHHHMQPGDTVLQLGLSLDVGDACSKNMFIKCSRAVQLESTEPISQS